jgi:hypothetical protein
MSVGSSRWEKARGIVAVQGIGGLVEEVGARLRYRLGDPAGKLPYHEFRTTDWDRRRRVQTEGNVWCESFDPAMPNREHAQPYIPTSLWVYRQLLGALVRAGVRPREFALVDYGCGKGRVVLMSVEAGFRAVTGVELNPELARLAAENFRNYRGRRRGVAMLYHGDATTFPIPPGPIVVFLYNPFGGPVLEAVADNIRQSFAEDPRPMYVVYHTPQPGSPFSRGTPFRLIESGPECQLYRLAREADEPEVSR